MNPKGRAAVTLLKEGSKLKTTQHGTPAAAALLAA